MLSVGDSVVTVSVTTVEISPRVTAPGWC